MIVYNAFFFEGKFDIEMFQTVVFSKDNVEAMTNTVIIGVAVTVFGTIVGLFYAWLLGRSDIPCKGLMRALFMIPYMFPPFFGAMAWDMLLSGRGGYVNTWLMNTFGFETAPLNINSLWGIIFVEVSYYLLLPLRVHAGGFRPGTHGPHAGRIRPYRWRLAGYGYP